MKIACVGAGPAGLYFAVVTKLRHPEFEVSLYERNPRGSTYGLGLVFWDDLRDQLFANDPVSAREIDEAAFRWYSQVVDINGTVENDAENGTSMGYSIKRQILLDILAKRAMELGMPIEYGHEVDGADRFEGFDLVVACDGANSRTRAIRTERFGTEIDVGQNKYIWLGTSKVFHSFTFPFVHTEHGWLWAHAYGISNDLSTFIVECGPETWAAMNFATLGADDTLTCLQEVFAAHLDGEPLLGQALNRDAVQWLNFKMITNEHWHDGHVILLGDAAHTTHFTIGSGTKLAIEDAIELANTLDQNNDVPAALEAYETMRKEAIAPAQSDASFSALWFENIPRYIDLSPRQFFVLMQARRSPILPRIPPLRYYDAFRGLEGSPTS